MKLIKFVLIFTFYISQLNCYSQSVKASFALKVTNIKSDSILVSKGDFKKYLTATQRGIFHFTTEENPGIYYIRYNYDSAPIYLDNGYNLTITTDSKRFNQDLVFSGNGAYENTYLTKEQLSLSKLWDDLRAVKDNSNTLKLLIQKKINSPLVISDPKVKGPLRDFLIEQNRVLILDLKNLLTGLQTEGKAAPVSFSYKNHKGNNIKLEDFKGKYVLIDVWATWCSPCIAEMPHLEKLRKRYSYKNFEIITISVDKEKDYEKWKSFILKKKLVGTHLFADNSFESEFVKSFGIVSLPRYLVVDPSGKVIYSNADRPSDPALLKKLDDLLKAQ